MKHLKTFESYSGQNDKIETFNGFEQKDKVQNTSDKNRQRIEDFTSHDVETREVGEKPINI